MEGIKRGDKKKNATFLLPLETIDRLAERAKQLSATKPQLVHNLIMYALLPEETESKAVAALEDLHIDEKKITERIGEEKPTESASIEDQTAILGKELGVTDIEPVEDPEAKGQDYGIPDPLQVLQERRAIGQPITSQDIGRDQAAAPVRRVQQGPPLLSQTIRGTSHQPAPLTVQDLRDHFDQVQGIPVQGQAAAPAALQALPPVYQGPMPPGYTGSPRLIGPGGVPIAQQVINQQPQDRFSMNLGNPAVAPGSPGAANMSVPGLVSGMTSLAPVPGQFNPNMAAARQGLDPRRRRAIQRQIVKDRRAPDENQ